MPKPPFQYEAGVWTEPDFYELTDPARKVPAQLACGSSFLIYAVEAAWINKNPAKNGCLGFDIATKPWSEVWDRAQRRAERIAKSITCPSRCPDLFPDEIWHGASCSRVNPPNWDLVTVGVLYKVECRKF